MFKRWKKVHFIEAKHAINVPNRQRILQILLFVLLCLNKTFIGTAQSDRDHIEIISCGCLYCIHPFYLNFGGQLFYWQAWYPISIFFISNFHLELLSCYLFKGIRKFPIAIHELCNKLTTLTWFLEIFIDFLIKIPSYTCYFLPQYIVVIFYLKFVVLYISYISSIFDFKSRICKNWLFCFIVQGHLMTSEYIFIRLLYMYHSDGWLCQLNFHILK